MKKKIATMTFHMAHNYGAMLQAYALANTINELGFQCEIIDYRFPYIDAWSGILTRRELVQRYGFAKGNAKFCKRVLKGYYKKIEPAHKRFNSFMRNKMPLSRTVYFNKEMLNSVVYDYIVFGSDQIWNPEIMGGFSPEYVGAFITDTSKTKLVSYAASSGKNCIDENYQEAFLDLLRRFYRISVREQSLQLFLKNKCRIDAEVVLDPVFLLSPEKWNALAQESEIRVEGPYVLVYAFEVGKGAFDSARRIAQQHDLRIISISYKYDASLTDIDQILNCGPIEFVWLFEHASYVCTSSFHGMAFSILFNKSFYCFGHPHYSQRNRDLLAVLGLQQRFLTDTETVENIAECDFSEANIRLQTMRDKSLDFLTQSFS